MRFEKKKTMVLVCSKKNAIFRLEQIWGGEGGRSMRVAVSTKINNNR